MMKLAARLVGRSVMLWGMYYRSLYPAAKPADFGQYDLPDPAADASLVAQRLAGPAAIVVYRDAGHYVHAEIPDVIATALLKFLAAASDA